jgi:hypothetical protein
MFLGLFAKEKLRMFQPIFSEIPLASHRKLTKSSASSINLKEPSAPVTVRKN